MCAVEMFGCFDSEARRLESARQESDVAFDSEWNVDTGGIYRPKEEDVCSENWAHGVRYQAVDPAALTQTLKGLNIAPEQFTFVDFGSGKGRAVMIAAGFGFGKVIGIEYCADLNRIAAENLKQHPQIARRVQDIELVTADATQVALPGGPLVLYLFNPFSRAVMSQVVANVTASFREKPRRMVVIYFTPYDADLWAAAGFLKRRGSDPAIFDSDSV